MDNGITAVFAHLSAFGDTVASLMKTEKYRNKSNTAELWFKQGEVKYRKGDIIAYSGSTGAGSAHLHFELRAGMDKPVNPMDFGYITKDTLAPEIREIWLIPRSDNSQIEGKPTPYKLESSAFRSKRPEIHAHGKIAIAIDIRDRECDANANTFGAYKIRAIANADTIFSFLADTINYSTTRQIGLLYELGHQEEFGYRKPTLRLEKPEAAQITMLKGRSSGILEVIDDTFEVTIEVADYTGNKSVARLVIKPQTPKTESLDAVDSIVDHAIIFSHRIFGAENLILYTDFEKPPAKPPIIIRNDQTILPNSISKTAFSFRLFDVEPSEELKIAVDGREYTHTPRIWRFESGMKYDLVGGWRIDIPEGGVYSPFVATDTLLTDSKGEFLRLDPAGVVLRRPAIISADTSKISAPKGKACIVRIWKSDTFFVSNEVDKNGRLSAGVNALGIFALAKDTLAPKLKFGIADSAIVVELLEANITDNLSGFSNDVLPRSFIGGEWIPTEYDPEKASLTVDVRNLSPGLYFWRVEAVDVCGNAVADSIRFVKK